MIIFVIIWLLLVLLFFLLLHFYVKKFLPQVGDAHRTLPILMIGARVHSRGSSFLVNVNNSSKGAGSRVISTIPLFVFEEEKQCDGLECVICLSPFEDGQVGRRLPSCHHAFHVECIDMWLHTHTTCPICRASAGQLPPQDPPQSRERAPSDLRDASGELVFSRLQVIVEVPSVEGL